MEEELKLKIIVDNRQLGSHHWVQHKVVDAKTGLMVKNVTNITMSVGPGEPIRVSFDVINPEIEILS